MRTARHKAPEPGPAPPTGSGGVRTSTGAPRRHAAFLHDFVHLQRSFSELAPVFADQSLGWLVRLGHGNTIRSGPAGADPSTTAPSDVGIVLSAKSVGGLPTPAIAVTASAPSWQGDRILIPMTWTPIMVDTAFPRLEGDLALSDLGESTSRLSLSARYRAPLRPYGSAFDRFAMHQIAESTVRRFLLDVEEAVC